MQTLKPKTTCEKENWKRRSLQIQGLAEKKTQSFTQTLHLFLSLPLTVTM